MKIIINNEMITLNNVTSVRTFPNNNNTYMRIEIDVELTEGTPWIDYNKETAVKRIGNFLRRCISPKYFRSADEYYTKMRDYYNSDFNT